MPSIKVYPPSQLPDREVSETAFNIWTEELEVYLSQEKDFQVFLPGEPYATWESQETRSTRLQALKGAELDLKRDRDATKDVEVLKKRQKDLRTVLSIIGKCVSQGHYNMVVRHSTSLEGIYSMLRTDYDIQAKGIHRAAHFYFWLVTKIH